MPGWGRSGWGGSGWGGPGPAASDLDAFSCDLGRDAGRLSFDETETPIPDGDFLFCLGHDKPGFFAYMRSGDSATIAQTGDFDGINAVTFRPRTRPPAVPPPETYGWVASILIDGLVVSSRDVSGILPEDWSTWTLDVSKLSAGGHEIAFRLAFFGDAGLVEVEVPAFYVDALTLSSAAGPVLINARPDFGEGDGTGDPPSDITGISFDLIDFGTDGIDFATINVLVDGDPAIVNGAYQTGYIGEISTVADVTHVVVYRSIPFDSGALVSVSVQASTVTSAIPLAIDPTEWTFRVADTIPPVISSATGRATKIVRVVWDEEVVAVSPTNIADALNPTNYTLTPNVIVGGVVPAVTPIVIGVTLVDATTFDLETDIDLSPGVSYRVTAEGVPDLAGNESDTFADFDAFRPPVPAGRDFNLYRMLSARDRERDTLDTQDLLRFVSCLQEIADLLLYDVDRWSDILDVDTMPESFVDAALLDLGNPFPFQLSDIDKRRLAKLLVAIYQSKGTADGIIDVVRFFLGLEVEISTYTGDGYWQLGVSSLGVDCVLGPGTSFARYAFRVVSADFLTADQLYRIDFIANYMKPAHTHLIEITQPFPPPVYDPVELGRSELGVDWILH